MRIGITGHQKLADDSQWLQVRRNLTQLLEAQRPPLVGVTSLAIGADQLFAEIVLGLGGSLEVVIPFEGYESKFETIEALRKYRKLLDQAKSVLTLSSRQSEEESYFEAGKRVVDSSELLIAVWDGREAEGLGGTADVVNYARSTGTSIHVVRTLSHHEPE